MDRAHRLGQKRTVHVFRLLMRDSLEERIMSLQRFKVDVANAVINQVRFLWNVMGKTAFEMESALSQSIAN